MALVAAARYVIDLRLGPRTLESARELLASVAACCRPGQPLLIEADEHRPYPQAILDLFGVTRFRRRRHGRGRRKSPDLKPPPGLLFGVVHKVRDACGNLLRVRTRRLFGRRRDILKLLKRMKLGRRINTGHIERLNGTMRTQQTRLARRAQRVACRAGAAIGAVALAETSITGCVLTMRWAVARRPWLWAWPSRRGRFAITCAIRFMRVTGGVPSGPKNAKAC